MIRLRSWKALPCLFDRHPADTQSIRNERALETRGAATITGARLIITVTAAVKC